MLNQIVDVLMGRTNGKVLFTFFRHFDVEIERTHGRRGAAAALHLTRGRRSTDSTDHLLVIVVIVLIAVQISRID